ncbi:MULTISPECIES: hypothetical protein [unclassified Streptomyces]|uniref:hypothetical protein n=1 Tax=unclassified Streptomyces TaxID=2593676 RepID=UPI002E288F53|nr:hypothetical protein [Streptomyces sp. NBC_00334]
MTHVAERARRDVSALSIVDSLSTARLQRRSLAEVLAAAAGPRGQMEKNKL